MRSFTWLIFQLLLAVTFSSPGQASLAAISQKSSRWLVWDSGSIPQAPDSQDLTLDTLRHCEFRWRMGDHELTTNNVFLGAPLENAPGLTLTLALQHHDPKLQSILRDLTHWSTVEIFETFANAETAKNSLVILLPEHHLQTTFSPHLQALHNQRNLMLLELAKAADEQNFSLINLAEGPRDLNWRSMQASASNSFFALAKSGISNIEENSRFIEDPVLFNSARNALRGQDIQGSCRARDTDMAAQILAASNEHLGISRIIFATFGLAHYPGISAALRNRAIPFLTIIPKQPLASRTISANP